MPDLMAKLATLVCPPPYCAPMVPVCSLNSLTRVGAGAELVVAAALQIETSQRDPFDQDLVGIILAPVDRSLKGVTNRSRKLEKMNCWICRCPSETRIGQVSNSFLVT